MDHREIGTYIKEFLHSHMRDHEVCIRAPHLWTLHCVVNIEELALSKVSQTLPSNVLIVKEVNLKIRDR